MSKLFKKLSDEFSRNNEEEDYSYDSYSQDSDQTPASSNTASSKPSPASYSAGTNLSSDVEIKGTLSFKNTLRLDGKFEGTINSEGMLIVGKNGDIKADINVGSCTIEGNVDGNIQAKDKVELRSNARIEGDITATRLSMSEGVSLSGRIDVNPTRAAGNIEKFVPKKKAEKPVSHTQEKDQTEEEQKDTLVAEKMKF